MEDGRSEGPSDDSRDRRYGWEDGGPVTISRRPVVLLGVHLVVLLVLLGVRTERSTRRAPDGWVDGPLDDQKGRRRVGMKGADE